MTPPTETVDLGPPLYLLNHAGHMIHRTIDGMTHEECNVDDMIDKEIVQDYLPYIEQGYTLCQGCFDDSVVDRLDDTARP
jgi:hypothetical protein